MFVRTERLILRPSWPEDAPRLAKALNQLEVSRNLLHVPAPYSVADAAAWIERPRDPRLPEFLALLRTRGAPRLVGGCGIARGQDGALELGYWVERAHWGLGFATEAARAVMRLARATGLPKGAPPRTGARTPVPCPPSGSPSIFPHPDRETPWTHTSTRLLAGSPHSQYAMRCRPRAPRHCTCASRGSLQGLFVLFVISSAPCR